MGLPAQFRTQWAKVKRTQAKFEKVDREFGLREQGYKDQGIPFSERIQERLLSSIQHWKSVRANQSVELLRLHALMLQKGEPVDAKFDRELHEKFVTG